MARYSKWFGGALGWAFGGPIGGLMGYVIGSMLDSAAHNDDQQGITQGGDFMAALLVLCAAIMKADGKVVKGEVDYFKEVFSKQFGKDQTKHHLQVLKKLLEQDVDVKAVCLQVRDHMDMAMRLQLMHFLFGIASADGHMDPRESKVISEIGYYLDISSLDMDSIRNMFIKDTESDYKIIEIDRNATDEEVKKAYKRMAFKHHPDKVQSLGEEYVKAAQEKFQEIQTAYENIRKERGF